MMNPEDLETWIGTIDERVTVLEAESATEYRQRIHDAYEVYANMEGIPITTYSERYLNGIINDMVAELKPVP